MGSVAPDTPGAREVTFWELEMTEPVADPPGLPPGGVELLHSVEPAPELSRMFYRLIGGVGRWSERTGWTDEQWYGWVDRDEYHMMSAWIGGAPAGYVELEQQDDGRVEIVYFGINPRYQGRGLGRWFLKFAVQRAWSMPGARRVWLTTCTLDGPAALPNYVTRGFTVVDEWTEWRLADSASGR